MVRIYMLVQPVSRGRMIMGRLKKGSDLLASLTQLCVNENIQLGVVRAIGAVTRARVGFYHQDRRTYTYLEFDNPHEIIGLEGNISLRDGQPFIHAHIALMAADGRMVGGHLAEGTEVFACEYVITELLHEHERDFERVFDEATGLYLWPMAGD
ncbi:MULTISPECIES: PPC domain-containing DNA-binding protein [Desulfofundulus]|nr:PPC domain-containing DNA-binding protein [Desulfofundulus sp. TPOSR]